QFQQFYSLPEPAGANAILVKNHPVILIFSAHIQCFTQFQQFYSLPEPAGANAILVKNHPVILIFSAHIQ
ncbi:hypothetical protein D8Y27_25620, partial [Escherichia coli]